jgi:hypothetical protein
LCVLGHAASRPQARPEQAADPPRPRGEFLRAPSWLGCDGLNPEGGIHGER